MRGGERRGEVLGRRRCCREGDVDASGHQHDEDARREDGGD